jgi:hypothetical protein
MPRFHLNIRKNGVLIEDPDGDEVENLEAARQIALDTLSDMRRLPHVYGELGAVGTKEFVITDEAGIILTTIPFSHQGD